MVHAAQDSEDENYWPGFVDALTTMVMVLTFIMMILGLTVFSLSQNVSRALLAEIAAATQVDTTTRESSEDLVRRIVNVIATQKKDVQDKPRKGPDPVAEPATEPSAKRDAVVNLPGDKQVSSAPAEMKPLAAGAAAGGNEIALTIVFQPNASLFDEGVRREIANFAAKARDGEFIIRAFAVENGGTISEARRLAYYRAMVIRQEMVKSGLLPAQLHAQIEDSTEESNRSLVRIFALRRTP